MAFQGARRDVLPGVLLALCCVGIFGAVVFWPDKVPTPSPGLRHLDASAEKGRYLATIGNCVSCHTTQGGQPFAGGVGFHTPFGVIYSTNITADIATGIGSWSFDDFYQAMKRGVRPDGTRLYPAFPYPSFAKLADSDIASIFLYVKSLRPVRAPARPNELKFPYNLRFTVALWDRWFLSSDTYAYDSTQTSEWNRGAYLVAGLGHCGECHTPRNALGAERSGLAFTGGDLSDEVRPGKFRHWSAVNLTPAKTGLARWSAADIATYLKTGENAYAIVQGPMDEVVMNSTRYLSDADARAIAAYLKTIPANTSGVDPVPSPEQLAAGERTYTVQCGTCHLPTGSGDEVLGVTLAGSAIVQASEPASFINVILYGPHVPPPPFVVDRTRMKAFGKRLSDQDVANLATYVRASFGNHAGPVTAELVSRQR
jgi:mono/diheme cytochrome c family protein